MAEPTEAEILSAELDRITQQDILRFRGEISGIQLRVTYVGADAALLDGLLVDADAAIKTNPDDASARAGRANLLQMLAALDTELEQRAAEIAMLDRRIATAKAAQKKPNTYNYVRNEAKRIVAESVGRRALILAAIEADRADATAADALADPTPGG